VNILAKVQKPQSGIVAPNPSPAREPVVEISRLTKSFGNFDAVKEVSLKLEAGKTLVLLGESGSGKTTVLRCVAGLERATCGTIRLGGTVVDDGNQQVPPESRRIGMVFQSYALWPQMTALENVVFAGMRDRKGASVKREVLAQAETLLETVGLASMKGRLPGQLSGGQQQRVALARALAGDVRLLLMDEPLSALDQAQPYATARVGADTITFFPVDPLSVGETVEIRWRREHTRLTPTATPGAPNQWPAQVTSAVYLGHRWEVGLDCLGVPIRAWSESEASDVRTAHVSPQRLLGYKPNAETARRSDTS
jgi:ABC-type polar amino acid transport system ATPase subunit